MNKLKDTDLVHILSRTPKDVLDMMKENTLYIGGGFIREMIAGNDIQDIDLFGDSFDELRGLAEGLTKGREARKHVTDNAITVLAPPRLPVQFITRWLYGTPGDLVKSFDFTVCQAIVWYDKDGEKWESMIHDDFYSDLAANRLVYTNPVREEEAGGSMMRVLKFLRRGYNIQPKSLADVMGRMYMKVDTDYIRYVPERDGARENWVSKIVEGMLREVDPLNVVDGMDFVDDHRDLEDF